MTAGKVSDVTRDGPEEPFRWSEKVLAVFAYLLPFCGLGPLGSFAIWLYAKYTSSSRVKSHAAQAMNVQLTGLLCVFCLAITYLPFSVVAPERITEAINVFVVFIVLYYALQSLWASIQILRERSHKIPLLLAIFG